MLIKYKVLKVTDGTGDKWELHKRFLFFKWKKIAETFSIVEAVLHWKRKYRIQDSYYISDSKNRQDKN